MGSKDTIVAERLDSCGQHEARGRRLVDTRTCTVDFAGGQPAAG